MNIHASINSIETARHGSSAADKPTGSAEYPSTDDDFRKLWNNLTIETDNAVGVLRLVTHRLLNGVSRYMMEGEADRAIVKMVEDCRRSIEAALPLVEHAVDFLDEYECSVQLRREVREPQVGSCLSKELTTIINDHEAARDLWSDLCHTTDKNDERYDPSAKARRAEQAAGVFEEHTLLAVANYRPRTMAEMARKMEYLLPMYASGELDDDDVEMMNQANREAAAGNVTLPNVTPADNHDELRMRIDEWEEQLHLATLTSEQHSEENCRVRWDIEDQVWGVPCLSARDVHLKIAFAEKVLPHNEAGAGETYWAIIQSLKGLGNDNGAPL